MEKSPKNTLIHDIMPFLEILQTQYNSNNHGLFNKLTKTLTIHIFITRKTWLHKPLPNPSEARTLCTGYNLFNSH